MNLSTFTILARDASTGDIAVAGGTNWFCYGRWVPHIEAGIGAVATQAETNMNWSQIALKYLKSGYTAMEALERTINDEPDKEGVYQLLIMDLVGTTASYTGKRNHVYAGVVQRKNYIVAGNTLVDSKTLEAVADYYENSKESFDIKLVKSLQAGHKVGGDIRGMKSAAIKIAKKESTGEYWNDIKLDLRIDESINPLEELERLVNVARAYSYIGEAEEAEMVIEQIENYKKALSFDPLNEEAKFWLARSLLRNGNKIESDILRKEIRNGKGKWDEYWERMDNRV